MPRTTARRARAGDSSVRVESAEPFAGAVPSRSSQRHSIHCGRDVRRASAPRDPTARGRAGTRRASTGRALRCQLAPTAAGRRSRASLPRRSRDGSAPPPGVSTPGSTARPRTSTRSTTGERAAQPTELRELSSEHCASSRYLGPPRTASRRLARPAGHEPTSGRARRARAVVVRHRGGDDRRRRVRWPRPPWHGEPVWLSRRPDAGQSDRPAVEADRGDRLGPARARRSGCGPGRRLEPPARGGEAAVG